MDGIVNVLKTDGPTSHDVVDQVRRIFGQRRVGHAGTLDPLATGVLVVCLGKGTRVVEYLTSTVKEYRAVLTLGTTTDSQDCTGEVLTESDASNVDLDALKRAIAGFSGEIEQIPPMISAIKHEGKPLYKHAREGRTIERAPRRVTVHCIDVSDFRPGSRAEADITVSCSSGTYIRTLCADIGEALGCGGMMSKLTRTRVGRFTIDGAVTVDQLRDAQAEGRLEEHVHTISEALDDMPAVQVDAEGERRTLHGIAIPAAEPMQVGGAVRIISPTGELLAIGLVDESDGASAIRPKKVLADSAQ